MSDNETLEFRDERVGYTAVRRDVILNPNLSLEAKAVYMVLCYAAEQGGSAIDHLRAAMGPDDTKEALAAALKELAYEGLLVLRHGRIEELR